MSAELRLLLVWLALLVAYRLLCLPQLGMSLFVDEAQYWGWSLHPDWGYYSKPPVIAWIIAVSSFFFGNGVFAIKLPAILLYAATAILIWMLGKRLYDARTGFRCAVAFSLMPFVSASSMSFTTDAPLLFFWTLGMWALLRAVDQDRWRDWLLLGACCGLGVMSKYTLLAFAPCMVLWFLLDPERRRQLANPRLYVAMLLSLLIVLPNILWNWAHDFPTLRHTAEITRIAGDDNAHGNMRMFLLTQFFSIGPVFAIAATAEFFIGWRNWRNATLQFLVCFCLPLFLLVTFEAYRAEANGNWGAPVYVAGLVLAVCALNRVKAMWYRLALACNIVLMLLAYHLPLWYEFQHKPLPRSVDYFHAMRAWDELVAQLRPLLAQNPGAVLLSDRRDLSARIVHELYDIKPTLLAWKPGAFPEDHYQFTTPLLQDLAGRRYLYISFADAESVTSRFAQVQHLAHLQTKGRGVVREADVYLLQGFKGYANGSVPPSPLLNSQD